MDSTTSGGNVRLARSRTSSGGRTRLLPRRLSDAAESRLTSCKRTHSSADILGLNVQGRQGYSSRADNMSPLTYRVSTANNSDENMYPLQGYDLSMYNSIISSPLRSIPLKATRSEVKIIRSHTAIKSERMKWSVEKKKYIEKIQAKMDLLNKEIYRLRINSKEMIQVNNHYSALEKHAKISARECTEMQNYLTELTIFKDMFIFKNSDSQMLEITELEKYNRSILKKLERMRLEKTKLENKIVAINKDLEIYRHNQIYYNGQDKWKRLTLVEGITQSPKSNPNKSENIQNKTSDLKIIPGSMKVIKSQSLQDTLYENRIHKKVEEQNNEIIHTLNILSNKLLNITSNSDFMKIIRNSPSKKTYENNIKGYKSKIQDLIQYREKVKNVKRELIEEIKSMNNKIRNLKKHLSEFNSNKMLNKTYKVRLDELQSKKDYYETILNRDIEEHLKSKFNYDIIKSEFDNNKNRKILAFLERDLTALYQLLFELSEEKSEIEATEPLSVFTRSTITLLSEINSILCIF